MKFQHGTAPFEQAEQAHVSHFASRILRRIARKFENPLRDLASRCRAHGLDRAAQRFDAALEAVQDGIKELEKP